MNTTLRNIRITDHLWTQAQAAAARRDETVSDAIRRCLQAYVDQDAN
jgi:antitoxin component of RelBE/YafQ-DinJ toxin-antitoxin module